MSDLGHDLTASQAQAQPPTSGQLLQNARKASGLSLEQLSARVKVSVPRLLALEEDRLEVWPDANVVRAVAATVCRQLALDPATVLDRLPKARQPALILPGAELGANFHNRSVLNLRRASVAAGRPGKAIVLASGFALLVFLVWVFGLRLQSELVRMVQVDNLGDAAQLADSSAPPLLPPQAGSMDLPSSAPAALSDANVAPVGSAGGATPGVHTLATKDTIADVSPPEQAPAAPSGVLVSFKAKGETWIEVNDAKGMLLLRRTMLAGDVARASGEVPLSVVVGRADHTEVAVRGQALTLEPSPDNVARFKVR